MQLADTLAERVLAGERVELGHDVGRPVEVDVRRDPFLDRDQAEVVEASRLRLRPCLERKLGKRWATPEREPTEQEGAPLGRRAVARVRQQELETARIDLLRRDGEEISGCAGDEELRPERLPQRCNGVLERRRRELRRLRAVELVHELLGRHHVARAEEQGREKRAWPGPAKRDRTALADHLERAEDPKVLHGPLVALPRPSS